MLVRVTTRNFCAGLVLDDDGVVVETAPILRFTLGWDRQRLVDRFRQEWDSKVELVR